MVNLLQERWSSGRIGTYTNDWRKEQCGCGNLGCSECYASGWKLVQIKDKCFPETTMNELFVNIAIVIYYVSM